MPQPPKFTYESSLSNSKRGSKSYFPPRLLLFLMMLLSLLHSLFDCGVWIDEGMKLAFLHPCTNHVMQRGPISSDFYVQTLHDPEKSFNVYSRVYICFGTQLVSKMNYYNLQQNALAALEEMGGPATISDQKGTVICPKPQRVGVFPNMPTRPLRWKIGEGSDSKDGLELPDIIFKESYGEEQNANQEASSLPYFLGSPPVRAANPLIQDAIFGYGRNTPQSTSVISLSLGLSSQSSTSSGLSSPSSPLRKGGCVRMKFGIKSATVRVVGFDCHVPAVA